MLLTLEKCKEHPFKNLRSDYTFLVFDELIQLLSQIVKDAQVEVQSVDLLDYLYPVLALSILLQS